MIYSLSGRYNNFTRFFDVRHYQWQKLMERFGFTEYKTLDGQYIEDVAWNQLGDATLWWVIAGMNHMDITVLDRFPPGRVLRIPTKGILDIINTPRQRFS